MRAFFGFVLFVGFLFFSIFLPNRVKVRVRKGLGLRKMEKGGKAMVQGKIYPSLVRKTRVKTV